MKFILKTLGIFILLSNNLVNAQNFQASVSGYVFDKESREALAGVNVYISNTTWGSATNKDGFYEITKLPAGMHELVVSMMGYKIKSRLFFLKRTDKKKINIMLRPVIYEGDTIEIVAADRADWYRNYDIFKEKFLGNSPYAEECEIKNQDALHFKNSSGLLYARTKKPLIIANKALGYEIHSTIMDFSWRSAAGRLSWIVKNRFIEMDAETEKQQKLWEKRRLETHEQSFAHFLQWLIYRENDKDYELVLCKRFPVTPLKMHEYFYTIPDSIIKKGEMADEHIIGFINILRITDNKSGQISYLKCNHDQVTLDEFGFLQEVYAFEVYGYWGTLGMANALPLYFNIEKWLK